MPATRPGVFFILNRPCETDDTVLETLKFAALKGEFQSGIRKHLGEGAPLVLSPFEALTGLIFRRIK